MPATPVIIEGAINGGRSKAENPNVPTTPDEIAADALACFEAGAAIVHNHIDRYGVSDDEAVERYLEGWRPVLAARPDALLYPTVNHDRRHRATSTSCRARGELALARRDSPIPARSTSAA